MTEHLYYAVDDDARLTLDVPEQVLAASLRHSRLAEILQRDEQLVLLEALPEGGRLTFDPTAFLAPERTEGRAEAHASQWLHTFNAVHKHTPAGLRDPRLDVRMSDGPLRDASGQGRRGMTAKLSWPLENDQQASKAATDVMRRLATTFGYLAPSISDSAGAFVHRERGVEFQALDMACSCLGTDGMTFRPEEPLVELHGHNLYNRQVVLTCLGGLVAAVHHGTISGNE